jgi:hypothetical protein
VTQRPLLILGGFAAIGGHGEVLLIQIHGGLFVQDDLLLLNGDGVIVGRRAVGEIS